jgi:hypothetical protein
VPSVIPIDGYPCGMSGMRTEVRIDARRLWGAGVATAAIAAAAGVVVFLFATEVFDVTLRVRTGSTGAYEKLGVANVAIVAFLAGIVATAVLHLMLRFVPRPKVFFFWLASLAMIASLLAPLSLQITDKAKVWLCSMHVVVGIVIISLLLATASRVMVTGPRVLDEPLTGPPGAI